MLRIPIPSRIAPAVCAVLAAGALPLAAAPADLAPAQLASLKARQSERAALAHTHLLQVRESLNLGAHGDVSPRQVSTNPQGRTVVRFDQTHGGRRVWAGEAIAHVEADGQVKLLAQGLKTGVSLESEQPRLTADHAVAAALRDLAPKGPMSRKPKTELVVFPTRFTGGIAVRFDAEKQRYVFDKGMSVWAKAPEAPYVLAYEVQATLSNLQDGHKEMGYIVDAATGAILRKWDMLQYDAPALGTGQSFFRGSVPIDTSLAADGTYSLVSPSRGSVVNPLFAENGRNIPGLTTCYGAIDWNVGLVGFEVYQGSNTTNAWGNGQRIAFPYNFGWNMPLLDSNADGSIQWLQGALTPSGETDAVDAHFGLSRTWDFYKAVFNRNGIDDQGTSTFAVVHAITVDPMWGPLPLSDNAFWSPSSFGMFFGEGTFGTPWADAYYGLRSMGELDITGHELSHGVVQYSANLIYRAESGGLNESTADIFGKMVQAWTDGGAAGSTIPDFPAGDLSKWEVARHSMPEGKAPLRFLYKPSLDGVSPDAWFDGIQVIDVHFSSGPGNRFFYFLACGSSTDPSSPTYSPYYPAGVRGLGNDKAARIWYKALTEYLPSDATMDVAREATVRAAQDLFGAGSPEETSVMQAWSAVNVGLAPGQASRPRVTFPTVNGEGSWLEQNALPQDVLKRVQIFPTSTDVKIRVNVDFTENKAVDWTVPRWNGYAPAGTMHEDGTWTTPNWSWYADLLAVRATSKVDPLQYAWCHVLLMNLDLNLDTEADIMDLGCMAMNWHKGDEWETPQPAARMNGGDNWGIVFFTQAFNNGFPVR